MEIIGSMCVENGCIIKCFVVTIRCRAWRSLLLPTTSCNRGGGGERSGGGGKNDMMGIDIKK